MRLFPVYLSTVYRLLLMKATTFANAILNYITRATTPSALTPYLGVLTAVETPTEPAGNNYARVQLTTSNFGSVAASATIANTAVINFPQASGSWGELIGFGIYDASTAGNNVVKHYLTSGSYFTFSCLASSDVFTAPGHDLVANDIVVVLDLSGSALPTGTVQGTRYYVINVSGDTFQLSATQGGASLAITTNGAGRVVQIVPQTIGNGAVASFPVGALVLNEF